MAESAAQLAEKVRATLDDARVVTEPSCEEAHAALDALLAHLAEAEKERDEANRVGRAQELFVARAQRDAARERSEMLAGVIVKRTAQLQAAEADRDRWKVTAEASGKAQCDLRADRDRYKDALEQMRITHTRGVIDVPEGDWQVTELWPPLIGPLPYPIVMRGTHGGIKKLRRDDGLEIDVPRNMMLLGAGTDKTRLKMAPLDGEA